MSDPEKDSPSSTGEFLKAVNNAANNPVDLCIISACGAVGVAVDVAFVGVTLGQGTAGGVFIGATIVGAYRGANKENEKKKIEHDLKEKRNQELMILQEEIKYLIDAYEKEHDTTSAKKLRRILRLAQRKNGVSIDKINKKINKVIENDDS